MLPVVVTLKLLPVFLIYKRGVVHFLIFHEYNSKQDDMLRLGQVHKNHFLSTFFNKSSLETECTLSISGLIFLLEYTLLPNHDSNSNSLLFKLFSSEQIRFIRIACPYGVTLLMQLR